MVSVLAYCGGKLVELCGRRQTRHAAEFCRCPIQLMTASVDGASGAQRCLNIWITRPISGAWPNLIGATTVFALRAHDPVGATGAVV